jgi:ABC-type multidrug transport system fused ATPase/permease subunit
MTLASPKTLAILSGLFIVAVILAVREIVRYRRMRKLVRWQDHPAELGGPSFLRGFIDLLQRRASTDSLAVDLAFNGVSWDEFARFTTMVTVVLGIVLIVLIWLPVLLGFLAPAIAAVLSVIVLLLALPLGLLASQRYVRASASQTRKQSALLMVPILVYVRLAMTGAAITLETALTEYIAVYKDYATEQGQAWLDEWMARLSKQDLPQAWLDWGRTYQVPTIITIGATLRQAQSSGAPMLPVIASMLDQTWRESTDVLDKQLRARQGRSIYVFFPLMISVIAMILTGIFLGNNAAQALHLIGL